MKKAKAKKWCHDSLFRVEPYYFENVPVWVKDETILQRGFATRSALSKASVGGDVIILMEREVAKDWVINFVATHRNPGTMTSNEIHAILLVLDIKKSDLAELLQVDKGSVTKYVKGTLRPTAPVATMLLMLLACELAKEGMVKNFVEKHQVFVPGVSISISKVQPPNFTLKAA